MPGASGSATLIEEMGEGQRWELIRKTGRRRRLPCGRGAFAGYGPGRVWPLFLRRGPSCYLSASDLVAFSYLRMTSMWATRKLDTELQIAGGRTTAAERQGMGMAASGAGAEDFVLELAESGTCLKATSSSARLRKTGEVGMGQGDRCGTRVAGGGHASRSRRPRHGVAALSRWAPRSRQLLRRCAERKTRQLIEQVRIVQGGGI